MLCFICVGYVLTTLCVDLFCNWQVLWMLWFIGDVLCVFGHTFGIVKCRPLCVWTYFVIGKYCGGLLLSLELQPSNCL